MENRTALFKNARRLGWNAVRARPVPSGFMSRANAYCDEFLLAASTYMNNKNYKPEVVIMLLSAQAFEDMAPEAVEAQFGPAVAGLCAEMADLNLRFAENFNGWFDAASPLARETAAAALCVSVEYLTRKIASGGVDALCRETRNMTNGVIRNAELIEKMRDAMRLESQLETLRKFDVKGLRPS